MAMTTIFTPLPDYPIKKNKLVIPANNIKPFFLIGQSVIALQSLGNYALFHDQFGAKADITMQAGEFLDIFNTHSEKFYSTDGIGLQMQYDNQHGIRMDNLIFESAEFSAWANDHESVVRLKMKSNSKPKIFKI